MTIANGKRFANTFLSLANLAYAIPDEVIIDKTNGRLYYKTPTGEVIDIFKNVAVDSTQISKELETLNTAIINSLKESKEYTDQQILENGGGSGGGGSTKTVYYRYFYKTLVDGETEITIPLSTFDDEDLLIFSVNTTLPDEGYTVTGGKIIFDEGLDINTGVSMLIIKNVPAGTEGSVSGNIFTDGTITEEKLDPALVSKINSGSGGSSVVVSETEPTGLNVGAIWMELSPTTT